MNITEFLNNGAQEKGFSFEVLPPLKGNGTAALFRTIDALKEFNPRFINITTHHSEFVYKELDNGLLTRQRVRRRQVQLRLQVPSKTNTTFRLFLMSFVVEPARKISGMNCSTSSS